VGDSVTVRVRVDCGVVQRSREMTAAKMTRIKVGSQEFPRDAFMDRAVGIIRICKYSKTE
jgi:hypothetical protein